MPETETYEDLYSADWTDDRLAAELAADIVSTVLFSTQGSAAKSAEVHALILAALKTR